MMGLGSLVRHLALSVAFGCAPVLAPRFISASEPSAPEPPDFDLPEIPHYQLRLEGDYYFSPPPEETAEPAEPLEVNLGVHLGLANLDGSYYDKIGVSLGISGLIRVQLDLYKQRHEQQRADSLNIFGLTLSGVEESERYQVLVAFGLSLFHERQEYLLLDISGYFAGGMYLTENNLNPDQGPTLPKNPDIDFSVGVLLRAELMYPFSHFTDWPFFENIDLGVGVGMGYFQREYKFEGTFAPEEEFILFDGHVSLEFRVRL